MKALGSAYEVGLVLGVVPPALDASMRPECPNQKARGGLLGAVEKPPGAHRSQYPRLLRADESLEGSHEWSA
jgi:hypothetical protein